MDYTPLRARSTSSVPWEALLFVLAAGGVALGFAAVGFWIASLRRSDDGDVQEGLYSGLSPLNGLQDTLQGTPAKEIPTFHFASPRQKAIARPNAGTDTYTVSTTPVRILSVSKFPGNRYVTIGTDEPVRMSTERAGFTTNKGVFIASGHPRTYGPFAPSVELWLVRGAATDALVGVITELRP